MNEQQLKGEADYQYDVREIIVNVLEQKIFVYEAADQIEKLIRAQVAKEQQ